MRIKLEVPADRDLVPQDVDDELFGWRVTSSVPGGRQYELEVPDDQVGKLNELVSKGQVVDWRVAHDDYRPFGFKPDVVTEAFEVGDTFPLLMGDPIDDVRRLGKWGSGVRLGHVDTRVNAAHEAFAGKTLVLAGDQSTEDGQDHGTHTLSTAAGVIGIASDAELYSVNVLPGGSGAEGGFANGVRWCADNGCRVITISAGGSASQLIDQSVQYAREHGCLVVVAAGNGGGQPIGSPARAADVVVMAVNRLRQWEPYTDGRGWGTPNRVACYGNQVRAAFFRGYGVMSGTSMATPHVAGVAAVLFGGNLMKPQVVQYVLAAAHQLPTQ